MDIKGFLQNWKYELLLIALIQCLYIGIFLKDMMFYRNVIWPLNMFILAIASTGVYLEKSKILVWIKNVLFGLVILLPLLLPIYPDTQKLYFILNIIYVVFYSFIFWEVMKFLVKPGYINKDIISASACGYFLLIAIAVFMFQFAYVNDSDSFKGISENNHAETFIDFVYFSTISITSIGYGDITPGLPQTKLLTSLIGVAGQFYSVILVGILISKFSNNSNENIS